MKKCVVNEYKHIPNQKGKCPYCGLYDGMCNGNYSSCNKKATQDFRGTPMCEEHYRDCCIRLGVTYGRDKIENIPL